MGASRWTWQDAVMALHASARAEERNALVLEREAKAYRRRGADRSATKAGEAAASAAASARDLRSQADALHDLMKYNLDADAGPVPTPEELRRLTGGA